jgi:hypothetical protein
MSGRRIDLSWKISQPSLWSMWTKHRRRRAGAAGALKRVSGQWENAPRGKPAVLFSSRHLSRKAARIDAEIDERVNDGSADERGDDNYQYFQAEGTHTGSPHPKGGYRSKAAIP